MQKFESFDHFREKLKAYLKYYNEDRIKLKLDNLSPVPIASSSECKLRITCGKAPALANTPASASQQAAQLSPRAAPPAECHDCKINIGNRPPKGRFGGQRVAILGVCPPKGQFRGQRVAILGVCPPNRRFCGQTMESRERGMG